MRLASFARADGTSGFGAVIDVAEGQRLVDLARLSEGRYPTLRALLADEGGLDFARRAAGDATAPTLPLEAVRLLPVIPDPDKIFCVGVNYASHVRETGREMPGKPMIFTRFAQSQIGHGADIILPHVSEQLDYEGELAIVIGRRSRYVGVEEAASRIAGYSCYNDASIRDWQRHSQQFTPGKTFPGTGAFGPWMVTTDEWTDLPSRRLQTRLNGQVVQEATLDDLIFGAAELVSYCSYFALLEPGDVIVTGTTGGVGAFRKPPLWMKPGDIVEVAIDGIGILRNGVAKEADDARI